ncbi:coiled-coil domain-containing protein SCD2 isoform X2 [Cucumis melo var. makuwa]|uniref:Coiled-coil domain-containing protein SCD2 isoform X2 n=1 Tax=Cucumis melo var. makuwa TaxID=1194695 RepID=A0A5D3D4B6_CUCMM|nr:coiled-coil domain-containing protein SCD2 isoform X2 [Cucumis melo var. makuwa]
MDRMRPVYTREKSNAGTPLGPASPLVPPFPHHNRSGSTGLANSRRGQNNATKAAAQRLAKVMASSADDEDDEDDLSFDYSLASGTGSIGLASGRSVRARSPMQSVRTIQEQPTPGHVGSSGRASQTVNPIEQSLSGRSTLGFRPAHSDNNVEQPPITRTSTTGRSSQLGNSIEQTPSTRSTSISRPNLGVKTVPLVPSSVSISLKPTLPVTPKEGQSDTRTSLRPALPVTPKEGQVDTRTSLRPALPVTPKEGQVDTRTSHRPTLSVTPKEGQFDIKTSLRPALPVTPKEGQFDSKISIRPSFPVTPTEGQLDTKRDKRLSLDMGSMNFRDTSNQPSSSDLQDELDMVQEENESLLEKLRLAEERCEEAEARARQLESQEGGSFAAERAASMKTETNYQAALRVASQSHGSRGTHHIAALKTEAETARDEATSALEHLDEAEAELQSLRIMTHRMILTKEEMEEVVLKRCWLARYWSLCVRYDPIFSIARNNLVPRVRLAAWIALCFEIKMQVEKITMGPFPYLDVRGIVGWIFIGLPLFPVGIRSFCSIEMNRPLGIHAEVAGARSEYWSSFTSSPVEVVLEAGKKAKEVTASDDLEGRENQRDLNEFSSETNVESMLLVERGLRELATLKVEDAVALAMARDRRANLLKPDEAKLPIEGQFEAFELSPEEAEDVSFKQSAVSELLKDRVQSWCGIGALEERVRSVTAKLIVWDIANCGVHSSLHDDDATFKLLQESRRRTEVNPLKDSAALKKWHIKAGKAMFTIKTIVDEEMLEYISIMEAPKKAWDTFTSLLSKKMIQDTLTI